MPHITPFGLARQTTMLAHLVNEAAEDSLNVLGDERKPYAKDAVMWTREIDAWARFADRQGWDLAARHACTQHTLACVACDRAGINFDLLY